MPDIRWLFLDTPIPYLAAIFFIAYRHDLGRLLRPFHDGSTTWDWYQVSKRLGLIGDKAMAPRRAMLGDSNLVLIFASLVIYAGSGYASLMLPWYYLCAIQTAVAAPLFLLVVLNRAGPFPFKPYRDVLPYPRLGTRVRNLGDRKDESRSKGKSSVSTAGGTP
ncbi:MAG: hypothetical protein JRM82_04255 [Nitrososphaerota archaeon]|nr:hypothetical protein [Nitrososphaerota archaeon]